MKQNQSTNFTEWSSFNIMKTRLFGLWQRRFTADKHVFYDNINPIDIQVFENESIVDSEIFFCKIRKKFIKKKNCGCMAMYFYSFFISFSQYKSIKM